MLILDKFAVYATTIKPVNISKKFFYVNPGRPLTRLSKDMNRFVFLKHRNIAVPVGSLFEVGRLRHDFLHLF